MVTEKLNETQFIESKLIENEFIEIHRIANLSKKIQMKEIPTYRESHIGLRDSSVRLGHFEGHIGPRYFLWSPNEVRQLTTKVTFGWEFNRLDLDNSECHSGLGYTTNMLLGINIIWSTH